MSNSSLSPIDRTHIKLEWTWEAMVIKWYSTFPKAPRLTIRLFNVTSRTLVRGRDLPLCRNVINVFYSPSRLDEEMIGITYLVSKDYIIQFRIKSRKGKA